MIALGRFEQRALEIAGDLNIHRGAQRWLRHPRCVNAFIQRAREDVVGIGRGDKTCNRQSHAHGGLAGEDVAKIAAGNDETRRPAEFRRRGEIVDALR